MHISWKTEFPTCIKNRAWHPKYISQNKVWMDDATCWKWFEDVFSSEVKKRTGRPVLLLLDNAPDHFPVFE